MPVSRLVLPYTILITTEDVAGGEGLAFISTGLSFDILQIFRRHCINLLIKISMLFIKIESQEWHEHAMEQMKDVKKEYKPKRKRGQEPGAERMVGLYDSCSLRHDDDKEETKQKQDDEVLIEYTLAANDEVSNKRRKYENENDNNPHDQVVRHKEANEEFSGATDYPLLLQRIGRFISAHNGIS